MSDGIIPVKCRNIGRFAVFCGKNSLGNTANVYLCEDFEAKLPPCPKGTGAAVYLKKDGHDFDVRCTGASGMIQFCGHGSLAAARALQGLGLISDGETVMLHHPQKQVAVICHSSEEYGLRVEKVLPDEKVPPWAERVFTSHRPEKWLFHEGVWIAVFQDEDSVKHATPDRERLALDQVYVATTAPGDEYDYVSRYFGPHGEDPATGSLQSRIAPYWANHHGRDHLHAKQVSAEGGVFRCSVSDQIEIIGKVKLL